ncbi:hypothetical protein [Arthrobacter sp. C152]
MGQQISAILATAVAVILLTGGPAESRADISNETAITTYVDCPLERIGDQLVRCDNLTGAGTSAPFWIPEQQ